MADGLRGWTRLVRATVVSYWGLGYALKHEEAFRIEAALCLLLVPAALWLGDNAVERAIMLMSLFIVVIVELLNTGIEVVVDRISTEKHPLSGAAKDVGSAAVHLSLIQVVVVWGLMIFG